MNRRMNSRKGAALIMALMVVVVGAFIIQFIFNLVYGRGWFIQEEKAAYVDHTTLVSHVQEVKGRIVARNLARTSSPLTGGTVTGGATLHTEAVYAAYANDPTGTLTSADLRFESGDFPPASALSLNARTPVDTGVGPRAVEVEVFDMFFKIKWINPNALREEGFPPVMMLLGEGGDSDPVLNVGDIEHAQVGSLRSEASDPELGLDEYGAYLIRAKLYGPRRGGRPIRVIEEAFVQVLSRDI